MTIASSYFFRAQSAPVLFYTVSFFHYIPSSPSLEFNYYSLSILPFTHVDLQSLKFGPIRRS